MIKVLKNLFGKNYKIHADEIAVAPGMLLSDAVVVESGGNETDGHYKRYGDGTQVCYMTGMLYIPVMTQNPTTGIWGAANVGDFAFPKEFLSGTVPFAEMKLVANEELNIAPRILTNTYFNASIRSITNIGDASRRYVLFAIGRWKE